MATEQEKNKRLLTRREREAIGAFVEYRALGELWHKQPGIDKVADEYGIEPGRMDTLAHYVFAKPDSDGVNPSCDVCGEFLDCVDDPEETYGSFPLCPSCDAEYWELEADDQSDYLYNLFPASFR
ncbi:MAG: hypothetical protein ACE5FA_08605 [Dehalococcoidia bacterium]